MQPTMILLVEDNLMVRNVVRDTLSLEGWQVDACENGITALRKIESGQCYDLIITDNDLPGMNGIELIRRARDLPQFRLTPIIMLSASHYQSEAIRAGANVFLSKPEDMKALVETISRLLST